MFENARFKTAVWVGHPHFSHSLVEMGWNVVHLNSNIPKPLLWSDLQKLIDVTPDLVVLGDRSAPPILLNVEDYPCPTCFFCVDSHIHSWYSQYSQCFDLVAVAMRDHIPRFLEKFLEEDQLLWLPLYARETDRPRSDEMIWDVVFVGKNDPNLTPGRYKLLSFLSERVPGLHIARGKYSELYPKARIVLNISEHGDLNFRVFEALGCEKCLLTPRVGHGLCDLFIPDVDLFVFDQDNPEELIGKIRHLLAHPELCEKAAASGYQKVNARHRPVHRARTMHQWIAGWDRDLLLSRRAKKGVRLKQYLKPLYLHWADEIDSPVWREQYLRAVKSN